MGKNLSIVIPKMQERVSSRNRRCRNSMLAAGKPLPPGKVQNCALERIFKYRRGAVRAELKYDSQ